jgi:toxin ParE1/3/4
VRQRRFTYSRAAVKDLADAWELVYRNDGEERADRVRARIEAFCRSLEEYPQVGTRRDEHLPGLRNTGVPGLDTVTLLFVVTEERVTVLRIGYLGRNVWTSIRAARRKAR